MTDAHPLDENALLIALGGLLADGRGRPIGELVGTFSDYLPDDPDEAEGFLEEVLDDSPRFFTLDDEHWYDLYVTLDGRWFTHRLTGIESAIGAVALLPDIETPLVLFDDDVPFADGTSGSIVVGDGLDREGADERAAAALASGALTGPDGWLGNVAEGALVAVRFTGGAIACSATDADPALSAPAADAVSLAFVELAERDDDVVELTVLVLSWLIADPEALRTPHEPLTDLLEAAGLETRGDYVGRRGSGWLTPPERMGLARRGFHEEVYGFEDCCHEALSLVERSFTGLTGEPPTREVAKALAHGDVAEAFAAELVGGSRQMLQFRARRMLEFTDRLLAEARGREAAGAHYVQSMSHECLSQTADAEEAARAALRADPAHPAANEAMAGYLADRGDATRALECLHRAGVTDEDWRAQGLLAVTLASAPKAGRNEPCPCGSGRKFKVCCADRPRIPAEQRFWWLYEKALVYATHPARRGGISHLAAHALDAEGSDESPAVRAATDRRLAELALFDDGVLERFVEHRGPLLPAGEAELAASWLGWRLGMFEIVDVEAGEGVQLRDTRTGETVWVLERVGSDEMVAGDLILARPLPDGDDLRIGGPLMRVPPRLRESLIALTGDPEADACDWAEWIGHAEAPPRLENREGEAIVACSARYRVADPEAARAALATALDRVEDGDRFAEHAEVDGDQIVRGFVTVTGDAIVVSANSVERAERLNGIVERLVDGAVLVDETRESVDDIRRRGGADPEPGEPVPPEAEDALAEFLADYARHWVDQPVPALGGLTPRQALDDPTRREDLLALLRDFERQERVTIPDTGSMPTAVVRAELGLV